MDASVYATYDKLERRHFWRVGKRRLILDWMARIVRPAAPIRILDVGGCCSQVSRALSAWGPVTVVEPDTATLAFVRSQPDAPSRLVEGSLPDGLPPGPFDLVTLFDVLEHVEEDVASLRAIRARLAPGGRLLLTVPAYPWLWSDHDAVLHHKRRYTRTTLRRALAEAGFGIDRMSYYTSLLLPLVAAARILPRRPRKGPLEYRVKVPPGPVNALLGGVMSLERGLLRWTRLPAGSALIAVTRPEGVDGTATPPR